MWQSRNRNIFRRIPPAQPFLELNRGPFDEAVRDAAEDQNEAGDGEYGRPVSKIAAGKCSLQDESGAVQEDSVKEINAVTDDTHQAEPGEVEDAQQAVAAGDGNEDEGGEKQGQPTISNLN